MLSVIRTELSELEGLQLVGVKLSVSSVSRFLREQFRPSIHLFLLGHGAAGPTFKAHGKRQGDTLDRSTRQTLPLSIKCMDILTCEPKIEVSDLWKETGEP